MNKICDIDHIFCKSEDLEVELYSSMLQKEPNERLDASECLAHSYFFFNN
jgi:hypothetical protein